MSEFSINLSSCKSVSQEMNSAKAKLVQNANSLQSAARSLRSNSDESLRVVSDKLNGTYQSVLDEAVRADSLASALETIINKYQSCEKSITGDSGKNSVLGTIAIGAAIAGAVAIIIATIQKIVDYDKKKKERERKKAELSEERFAEWEHDIYMQDQIFALMKDKRFSERTWKKASLEERRAILEAFMLEVAGIMGITITGDIDFFFEDSGTVGYYHENGNQVHINTNYLGVDDDYSLMQVVIHEMRHAYQYAAFTNPGAFQVSQETLDQWRANWYDYYDSDAPDYYYGTYLSQPIEYDTFHFAKQTDNYYGYEVNPTYKGSW